MTLKAIGFPFQMDSSPLALLAQTCNSIGLPDPPAATNSKSGSAKTSKSDSKDPQSSKSTHSKEESKMASSTTTSRKNHSNSSAAAAPDSVSDSSAATDRRSVSSVHSDHQRKSENRSRNSVGQHSNISADTKTHTTSESSEAATKTVTTTSSSASAPLSNKCNVANGNPITFPSSYPPTLFPPYFPSTSTATPGSFPFGPAAHLPPLPLTAGPCFPSFPTATPGASWLGSPPSSLPGFAPKCSDPFCKTCPAIAAAAAVRAGAGACGTVGCPCAQFGGPNAHNDLSSLWLSYGSLFGLHGAGNTTATNPLLAAAAASAYAASAASSSSALAAGQQHTCSWMTGNEFCGKRFSSSEELLQHLRTHTSQESAKAPLVTGAPGPLPIPPMPGRLSPRASSYLNTLNSFRFHPYSPNKFSPSSSSAAAAAAALASLQFPPTAFNPQALCGSLTSQRLPGTLPHP